LAVDYWNMIIFIITRLLDVITTLLNIQKYGGWEVELNPTMRWIGTRGLFIPYQIVMLLGTTLIVSQFVKHKNLVFGIFSFISMIAVAINIYCLTL